MISRNKEKTSNFPLKAINFAILLSFVFNLSFPQVSFASSINDKDTRNEILKAAVKQKIPAKKYGKNVAFTKYVTITAYSSTVDQCDSTPFITANGTRVHSGTIAANFLKFGTKVRIPEYFGNKIFTVEDRTHPRYGNRVDVWMKTRSDALNFGIRKLKIEVLK